MVDLTVKEDAPLLLSSARLSRSYRAERAFKNGDQMAADLDYVAIPDAVVKLIQSAWKAKIKDASGKALY